MIGEMYWSRLNALLVGGERKILGHRRATGLR
jgi:hypothetical protein